MPDVPPNRQANSEAARPSRAQTEVASWGSSAASAGTKIHHRQALLMGAALIAGTAAARANEQRDTYSQVSRDRFQLALPIPPVSRPTRIDADAERDSAAGKPCRDALSRGLRRRA